MVGNVGSGKSTTSNKLQGIKINDDSLSLMFHGNYAKENFTDYWFSFYSECILLICKQAMIYKQNIVVDQPNLSRYERRKFISLAKEFDYEIIVHNHKRNGLEKRMKENRGYAPEDWIKIFNEKQKEYQEPLLSEGITQIIIYD